MTDERRAPFFYVPLKAFSFVALTLMAAAIAYVAWISLSNWGAISV
jgi:hypothetical protein